MPFNPEGGHYYDKHPPAYHNPQSTIVPWWGGGAVIPHSIVTNCHVDRIASTAASRDTRYTTALDVDKCSHTSIC